MEQLTATGSVEFVSIPSDRNRIILVDWEARKLFVAKVERQNPEYLRYRIECEMDEREARNGHRR
jgi:hypothetical protein